MNARQFFELVIEMRVAQKEYFKTRSKAFLESSKRFEKQVDDEIERVCKILREQQNNKQ